MKRFLALFAILGISYGADTPKTIEMELYSNHTGTPYVFEVFKLDSSNPMEPGRFVQSWSALKSDDALPRENQKIQTLDSFVFLRVFAGDVKILSQPITSHSSVGVLKSGELKISFSHSAEQVPVPDWLWKTIKVVPFDWQTHAELIRLSWVEAYEWAQQNNVPQGEIKQRYLDALYPNINQGNEKAAHEENLFPSCLHGIYQSPEVVSTPNKVLPLTSYAIIERWSQENPGVKLRPSEDDLRQAEQALIAANYPLFCHSN